MESRFVAVDSSDERSRRLRELLLTGALRLAVVQVDDDRVVEPKSALLIADAPDSNSKEKVS